MSTNRVSTFSKFVAYLLILALTMGTGVSFVTEASAATDPYVQRQNDSLSLMASKYTSNKTYGACRDTTDGALDYGRDSSYLLAKMEIHKRGLPGGWTPSQAASQIKHLADVGLAKMGTDPSNPGPWSWVKCGRPGPFHSVMNLGFILNKWGDQLPTDTKNAVISYLSNAAFFTDNEDDYLVNARFNEVVGKMLAGEYLGYTSNLWQEGLTKFNTTYNKTMKYGGIEMNSPIYSAYVFPALMLLTELKHPIYSQKAQVLLDYKLMLHGHLYLPGGGLGAPKHREREGGEGKFPDALNSIYHLLFGDKPLTSSSSSFHMIGAAASYKPPAIIESIFMNKGDGYKFRAWTHGIQSGRNPYGMYPFSDANIAPWEAVVAPAGDVMLGFNYGTRITAITMSNGLMAKGSDGKFHTLYQYQPAIGGDTLEELKADGTPRTIDAEENNPDDFDNELYDYERMLYGNTYLSIWDPTLNHKQSWAVRQSQYTVTRLPRWDQHGGTMAPVSQTGWYVGQMGSTYIAYKPLGPILNNYVDSDAIGHYRFLKMDGRSGGITEIATTAQFATIQDYITNLDSRYLNFNRDPATFSVEFDALEPESNQFTRVKLEYRPEKRYIKGVEKSANDLLNHGFIDSPWAKYDSDKKQIAVERPGYSSMLYDIENGTIANSGVWYSKSLFPAAINLGTGNKGLVTLNFNTTPLANNIDGVIGYADSSTTIAGYTDLSAIVRMNTSGYFDAFNGTGYQADVSVPYTANTKYYVEMEVDFNTSTYNVFITPQGGSKVQLAKGYAFRTPADDLGKIALKHDASASNSQFKIENHKIGVYEDFSVDASNFTVRAGGTWGVSGGRYKLSSPATTGGDALWNISTHNASFTGDFTFQSLIRVKETTSSWNDAAVIFNFVDENNYYYAAFNESNDMATNGIFKVENGVLTELADFATLIVSDKDYKVEIVRSGTSIEAKLNGSTVGTAVDGTFTSGNMGFGSKNDEAEFDNFFVLGTIYTVADTQAPSAPSNLSAAAATTSKIKLSWTASTDNVGVSGYKVYRDGAEIGTTTLTSYTDSGLNASTTYSYTVKAYDASGNVSADSNVATATTYAIYKNFSADAADFTVQAGGMWGVSNGRYVLSSPATTGGDGLWNISTHNTSLTGDLNLRTVLHVVGSTSSWDDAAVIFNYMDADNYYFASFNESNDTLTNGLFKMQGGILTELVDFTPTITSDTDYTVQIIKSGTTITVKLDGSTVGQATDGTFSGGFVGYGSKNDSAQFDNLRVHGTIDREAPSAPTNLKAWASTTSKIKLSWTASTDNVGVTGYKVYRDGAEIGTTTLTSYTDSGLNVSTTYSYKVKAYDANGNVSADSNVATATTYAIYENFSADANNFTVQAGGIWGVSNGRYVLSSPATTGGDGLWNISTHNTSLTGDLNLKTLLHVVGSTSTWNDAAVIFNYVDANNYYFAAFNENNDHLTNGIFKLQAGVLTELADFTPTILSDTDYTVQIVKSGTTITVKLDGTTIGQVSDSTFSGGYVGYGTKNDSAQFDTLRVHGTISP